MVGENQRFSINSNLQLDPGQIKKILTSPEGAALVRLLQRDGGAGLKAAADSLRRGDTEAAKAALSPLLQGTDGEDLASRLGEQL